MSENALGSHGTIIQIGDGAGTENFTNVAEVKDVSGPDFLRELHDASAQTDTDVHYVPGMRKVGEISFPLNFIPTNATQDVNTGLLKDHRDGTLRNFKMIFPDIGNTEWLFPCYVKSFAPAAPNDGLLEGEVTLQPSGTPTLA